MPFRKIWLPSIVRGSSQPDWNPRLFWVFAAIAFAVVQSCLGLFILSMALVNSNPSARTLHDRLIIFSIYAIWVVTLGIIVGVWRRWHVRTLGLLAGLILVCWFIFYMIL
jgi:hypothetical protein